MTEGEECFWTEEESYVVEAYAAHPEETSERIVAVDVSLAEAEVLRQACAARGEIAIVYPTRYRAASVTEQQARTKMADCLARHFGVTTPSVDEQTFPLLDHTPYYWEFSVASVLPEAEPSIVLVDRLDGHVWTLADGYCCARRQGRCDT